MMKKYRINRNVERFFLCLWPIIFYDTFDKCNATERFSNLSSTQVFSMMECTLLTSSSSQSITSSDVLMPHFYIQLVYRASTLYILDGAGNFFSEALILASTNPHYNKRLFIDLPVQYLKTTSSDHVVYIDCFLFMF